MLNYEYKRGEGTHTVRTDFQYGEYKGYVVHEVGGNTCGYSVLEGINDTITWVRKFKENTCNFEAGEDDWFNMTLVDNDGNELILECEINELSDYIVGVRIVDYKKETTL